ncbi:MAG: hypothetical protein J6K24_07290 [Tidjanibacter sp.]|nr:hypothetical protein [Tidjanibacter sp.]
MNPVQLEGLMAIILFFAIPIVAITMVAGVIIKRNSQRNELRSEIIRNGTSPEMAELLLKPTNKERSKVVALRWGITLVGVGLAALVCNLAGLSTEDIYTWLYIALGGGVGLIVAFVLEMRLASRQPADGDEAR